MAEVILQRILSAGLTVTLCIYFQWRRFVLEIGGTSAEGASVEPYI